MRAALLMLLAAVHPHGRPIQTDPERQVWAACCSDGKMQVCVGKVCNTVPERWALRLYVPATYDAEVTAASVLVPGFASESACEAAAERATYWARGMYPPDAHGVDGVPAHFCSLDWP